MDVIAGFAPATHEPPSPTALREHLGAALSGDPVREDVLARWDRWGQDLLQAVADVYADSTLPIRLVDLIATGHLERRDELRTLDRQRLLRPDWFQMAQQIGYAAYTERFAGTLAGVADHIGYLTDLGVTHLHLMPLLAPRPAPNDGGYAVVDYDKVRPDLGTMDDLSELAERLHDANIALTLDLVLNHVAYEHPWAVAAREGDERYRHYFWMFEDRFLPDAYERDLIDVFPTAAPGSFTWVPGASRWVWTTFNAYQWDLNWSNPDVLCEFVEIILRLANRGVDCLRLDAIAFLWKRLGTHCQNQPEVHAITQILRAAARIAAPALIFKAEAIVAPEDVVTYLGRGEHAGRVSDLAYHNSLMVQIWSALATRDARLLSVAMSRMPPIPTTTSWATYLRCHDDIGWAVADEDAETLGLDGACHRSFLSDFYTGTYQDTFAQGVVFQHNPVTGDRRVNGTAASLCGVGTGEPGAVARLLCAYAMVLGFGGIPLIYMGDEVALLNDDSYLQEPEHAADSRWVHRPRMPWQDLQARPEAQQTYQQLRSMIMVRKATESLHASVATAVMPTSVDSVVCFVRRHPAGDLLQVYNVADYPVTLPLWELHEKVPGAHLDLLTGDGLEATDGRVELAPYARLWLVPD